MRALISIPFILISDWLAERRLRKYLRGLEVESLDDLDARLHEDS